MKSSTSAMILASTLPLLVSASPIVATRDTTPIADNDAFSILTIRSASDLQYGSFQAVQRSLLINTPSQNATCSSTPGQQDPNSASFYLSNGSLFLLTPPNQPVQQFFVDRSGMGQGVIQYSTGVADSPLGRNQERGPFAIDSTGNLVFGANKDIGFQACPGARQGGWSVWLQGQSEPGFNKGCLPFLAKAVKEDAAVACEYTSE